MKRRENILLYAKITTLQGFESEKGI